MKAGVAVLKLAAVLSSLLLGSAFVYYRATGQTPWFLNSSSEGAATAPPVKSPGQGKLILTSSKSFAGGTAISGGGFDLNSAISLNEQPSLFPAQQGVVGYPPNQASWSTVNSTISWLESHHSKAILYSSKSGPIFLPDDQATVFGWGTDKLAGFHQPGSAQQHKDGRDSDSSALVVRGPASTSESDVVRVQRSAAPVASWRPVPNDERTEIMVSSKSAIMVPVPPKAVWQSIESILFTDSTSDSQTIGSDPRITDQVSPKLAVSAHDESIDRGSVIREVIWGPDFEANGDWVLLEEPDSLRARLPVRNPSGQSGDDHRDILGEFTPVPKHRSPFAYLTESSPGSTLSIYPPTIPTNHYLQLRLNPPSVDPPTELQRAQLRSRQGGSSQRRTEVLQTIAQSLQPNEPPAEEISQAVPFEEEEAPERTVIMSSSKSLTLVPPPRRKTPRSPTMQKTLVLPGSKGGTLMITPTSPPSAGDGSP